MSDSPTEMELRVAKALWDTHLRRWRDPRALGDGVPEEFLGYARAAIRAMRIPTADMCEEVIGMFMGSDIRRMAASTFQRMIDVASPAKPLPDAPQGALPK